MTYRVLGSWMFAIVLVTGPVSGAEETEPPDVESKPSSEEAAVPPAEDAGTPETLPECRIRVDLEAWVPQASGLDQLGATRLADDGNPFGTSLLTPEYSTKVEGRFRLDYQLPNDLGALGFSYQKHADEALLRESEPSNFIFGEIAVNPALAGLFDGSSRAGLADAFDVNAKSALRDVSFTFRRELFGDRRVKSQWHVDWRRVKHTREDRVSYYALAPVPPVPVNPNPLIARPDLLPEADRALIASAFNGRGPGVGLDVQIPLWQDKFLFEGGASVALLRGDMDSESRSVTWAYVLDVPDNWGVPEGIVKAPFAEFEGTVIPPGVTESFPLVNYIQQVPLSIGVASGGQSASAQAWDGYLGFRWHALNSLEVYAGIRGARYADVARELRPQISAVSVESNGTLSANLQTISETDRSLTLEGLYIGLTYRFW